MLKFWNKSQKTDVENIAKEQLEKNKMVFESLRKYDEGEKDISTTKVKEHLQHL